jgi:hypothetical protein
MAICCSSTIFSIVVEQKINTLNEDAFQNYKPNEEIVYSETPNIEKHDNSEEVIEENNASDQNKGFFSGLFGSSADVAERNVEPNQEEILNEGSIEKEIKDENLVTDKEQNIADADTKVQCTEQRQKILNPLEKKPLAWVISVVNDHHRVNPKLVIKLLFVHRRRSLVTDILRKILRQTFDKEKFDDEFRVYTVVVIYN